MIQIYLISMILFVAFSGLSYSQLLIGFKAKDGINDARASAAETVENPKLMTIGTMSGDFEFSGMPISIAFDESKGTSQIWAYFFTNTETKTNVTIAVARTIAGYMPIPIDPSMFGAEIPFESDLPLDDYEWMNSDAMINNVKANQDYIAFKTNNPNMSLLMAGLGVEPMESNPVWGSIFRGENGNLNCLTNAITGETVCLDFTDVLQKESNLSAIVYPNPAMDFTTLQIPPLHLNVNSELRIYDILGNEIVRLSGLQSNDQGIIPLDVSRFNSGIYKIVFTSGNVILNNNLIITR